MEGRSLGRLLEVWHLPYARVEHSKDAGNKEDEAMNCLEWKNSCIDAFALR
jgi:hypothetical protein